MAAFCWARGPGLRCRQLEKILFPLELTVFFAQTVELSALVARQLALIGGAVYWRLVLVGLVTAGQSEGHGVSPIDLSTISGQAQFSLGTAAGLRGLPGQLISGE